MPRRQPVDAGHESPLMPRLLPWVALSLWATAAVTAAALRPGELLEFGLVGVAGLCAWQVIRSAESRRLRVTATLLFFVPLLNTWPPRALYAQIDSLGVVAYVLSPSSLLALLILGGAPRPRALGVAALPLAVTVLLVAAVLVSTAVSSDRPAAAASAWVTLILPLGAAAAIARVAGTTRARWTLLAAPALASLVPAAMGVTAYVISFGVPSSFDDILSAKALLYRTGLVQEVTFGNVSHVAAFGVLMAPVALTATFSKSLPRAARACAGASAVLLATAMLAVYSRAAILVCAGLLGVSAVLVAARWWQTRRPVGIAVASGLAAAAAVVGTFALLSLSPDVRPTAFPSADVSPAQPPSDASVDVRLSAIRTGFRLFSEHPLGVGTGQYAAHERLYTAPHSLFVRLLVENGFLGGAAFLALLTALCLAVVRFSGGRLSMEEWLLRTGCTLGAGGFLVFGLIAGAPLALGTVSVWSLLLATQLGILFSKPEVRTL